MDRKNKIAGSKREIQNMSDRDLDIKIAEEVMDWTNIKNDNYLTSAVDGIYGYPPIDPRQPNAWGVGHHLPHYTNYLPAAWGIVDYLGMKYKNICWQSSGGLSPHNGENKVKFRFFIKTSYGDNGTHVIDPISDEVESDSLPMAICLASLTIKNTEATGIYFQKQTKV